MILGNFVLVCYFYTAKQTIQALGKFPWTPDVFLMECLVGCLTSLMPACTRGKLTIEWNSHKSYTPFGNLILVPYFPRSLAYIGLKLNLIFSVLQNETYSYIRSRYAIFVERLHLCRYTSTHVGLSDQIQHITYSVANINCKMLNVFITIYNHQPMTQQNIFNLYVIC